MRGSCLCGVVRYQVLGAARSIVACHCHQCRKSSGHYVAATQVAKQDLQVSGADAITWYRSSDAAERGFCGTCGSNLFWRRHGASFVSIFAGSIDGPTGLIMDRQLHAESKGDYYELPDLDIIDQSALARDN